MIIRQKKTYKIYFNSNGDKSKYSSYEYCILENKDFKSYKFETSYIGFYEKNKLYTDLIKLEEIFENYNKLLQPYRAQIDYLLEVEVKNIDNIFSDSFNYLEDDFTLYSLNIKAKSNTTNRWHERGFGARDDLSVLCGLENELKGIVSQALCQANIKTLQAGFYDVILDPEATGLLVHEFVGHLFEADNNIISKEDVIKQKIVSKSIVNIVDDSTLINGFGTYKFDDEGEPGHKTFLIKNGRMHSLLNNMDTASKLCVLPTSNARAIDCMHLPIVRMSNTYMLPGQQYTPKDLIESVEFGLYILGTNDSITGSRSILGFREIYIIEKGKIVGRARNMRVMEDGLSVLSKIEMIANDFKIYGGGTGGCFKNGQGPLNVSSGGPHVKLHNVFLLPDVHK